MPFRNRVAQAEPDGKRERVGVNTAGGGELQRRLLAHRLVSYMSSAAARNIIGASTMTSTKGRLHIVVDHLNSAAQSKLPNSCTPPKDPPVCLSRSPLWFVYIQ